MTNKYYYNMIGTFFKKSDPPPLSFSVEDMFISVSFLHSSLNFFFIYIQRILGGYPRLKNNTCPGILTKKILSLVLLKNKYFLKNHGSSSGLKAQLLQNLAPPWILLWRLPRIPTKQSDTAGSEEHVLVPKIENF